MEYSGFVTICATFQSNFCSKSMMKLLLKKKKSLKYHQWVDRNETFFKKVIAHDQDPHTGATSQATHRIYGKYIDKTSTYINAQMKIL